MAKSGPGGGIPPPSRNTKRVSVLVVTYNHERYISQALDSVLMQQTNFDWEILVSEDCSTDRTRHIVKEYAARHPGLLRLILSEKNLHSNEVVARAIRAAQQCGAGTVRILPDGSITIDPRPTPGERSKKELEPERAIVL